MSVKSSIKHHISHTAKGISTFLLLCIIQLSSFTLVTNAQVKDSLLHYFDNYVRKGEVLKPCTLSSYDVLHEDSTIRIKVGGGFGEQAFTPAIVNDIYKTIRSYLPDSISSYRLEVSTSGRLIEELVPNYFRPYAIDSTRIWTKDHSGHSWTRNNNAAFTASKGLDNRHIAVWQSHGRYNNSGTWSWQRPRLYCTTEDLFSQTFVIPYIIPMLENAGAIVYTPRERNWQNNEIIVDNDKPTTDGCYREFSTMVGEPVESITWKTSEIAGFAHTKDIYSANENPFTDGTARYIETSNSKDSLASTTWQPYIPETGQYAVYVSYQTTEESIDNAIYQVHHNGIVTEIEVNQKIGGGTWVYIGTFSFDEGINNYCKVVLLNQSSQKGIVSADAVRFGAGYGNVTTSTATSGLPRWAEASRYYAQWAGFSDKVYDHSTTDYNDDLYARPYSVNNLAGESAYIPDSIGRKVPIELAVAFHTDAGFKRDDSKVGSLSICTTSTTRKVQKKIPKPVKAEIKEKAGIDSASVDSTYNDSLKVDSLCNDSLKTDSLCNDSLHVNSIVIIPDSMVVTVTDTITSLNGIGRFASYDLASMLITNLSTDLEAYNWPVRHIQRRSPCETREPAVPSVILEMLSHQNFADMCLGYDPKFKFDFSRSVYKTILKYVATTHHREYVVQPLPVRNFSTSLSEPDSTIHLSWESVNDPLEPTARPQFFIVYTRINDGAFDNGKVVRGASHSIKATPGNIYSFYVVAANNGGCSFPSETLSAYISPTNNGTIMLVNAFTRLEGPAQINTSEEQGFDLDRDPGVQYGAFAGYCGRQKTFSKAHLGSEATNGTGYSGNELEGRIIMGNTFDYPFIHGKAIKEVSDHSFCSASIGAVMAGNVRLDSYKYVDLICGVQKEFDSRIQSILTSYVNKGNRLIITGANLGGLLSGNLAQTLSVSTKADISLMDKSLDTVTDTDSTVTYTFWREMNDKCYSVPCPTSLTSEHGKQFLIYADKAPAAYFTDRDGKKAIVCGFPFETIAEPRHRNMLMADFLKLFEQ